MKTSLAWLSILLACGARACLTKPPDIDALLAEITAALRRYP